MMQLNPILCGVWSVLLTACATVPMQAAIPETLVPEGQHVVDRVGATGVQIYECRAGASGPAWAFVGPEAELTERDGRKAGTHYAGPHWEALDGSKIVGAMKARSDAPHAGAIPWLLLTARSVGKEGRFSKVTSVQRVNTVGGVTPTAGCDAKRVGAVERVPYTADYILLAPKAAAL